MVAHNLYLYSYLLYICLFQTLQSTLAVSSELRHNWTQKIRATLWMVLMMRPSCRICWMDSSNALFFVLIVTTQRLRWYVNDFWTSHNEHAVLFQIFTKHKGCLVKSACRVDTKEIDDSLQNNWWIVIAVWNCAGIDLTVFLVDIFRILACLFFLVIQKFRVKSCTTS